MRRALPKGWLGARTGAHTRLRVVSFAWPLLLLAVASAALGHDGWTPAAAGCRMLAEDGPRDTWLQSASSCAAVARRLNSREAALRSAHFYLKGEKPEQGREVLLPFESSNDVRVLYYLAWFDSRMGKRELAVEEYRRAYQASQHLADGELRATTATLFGYELYRASQNEEAVRVLNKVLQQSAGTLGTQTERDARLNLARSLQELGDAPAAEAELQRLRQLIGTAPLSSLELLLDARLHAESGQLQSALALLAQAQAAARRESNRLREAFVVMRELEIAVTQGDWERVRALLAEVRTFEDGLRIDDRRQLTFDEAVAARVEGRLEESRTLLEQTRRMSPPPTSAGRLLLNSDARCAPWGSAMRLEPHFGSRLRKSSSSGSSWSSPPF